MSNTALIAFCWFAVAAHIAVGIAAQRRLTPLPLVPLLNGVVGICLLLYWAPKWFGYLTQGITWYGTDQLLPLYGACVCVLVGLTLAGRYNGTVPNWLVFGLHTAALVVAALFFSLWRMDRLM